MPYQSDRGREGEDRAVTYMEDQGYELLERNFTISRGELDAVFRKKDEVVFVEVKTRESRQIVPPEESIPRKKQMCLIRTALVFIKQNRLWGNSFRFDVVIVGPEGLRHIENAFASSSRYTV